MRIQVQQFPPFPMRTFMREHTKKLNQHLREKFINRFWLAETLVGKEEKAHTFFPYSPEKEGVAKIDSEEITTNQTGTASLCTGKKPRFLINIPLAHRTTERGYKKITRLFDLFRTQSYGETSKDSALRAPKRLAIVIGVNQIKSIDPRVNQRFREYIESAPGCEEIPSQITGFFWIPKWDENTSWKEKLPAAKKTLKVRPELKHRIYSKKRAFLILKSINPQRADLIRRRLEGTNKLSESLSSQIPFQKIRETIKNSGATKQFAKAWHVDGKKVFLMTMDADLKRLRRGGKGYFTRYEEIIEESRTTQGYTPSVISLGYQLPINALPIPALAVKCDMAVRKAMNRWISGSVYLPEPGTAYYLSRGGNLLSNLKKFSFCGGEEERAFESRRALTNGVKMKILDLNRVVFDPSGALITSTPSRMKTETCAKYETLTPADLKKEAVLKALRGISQVHFHPFHWGHYVYESLPSELKCGRGVYGKLNGIFKNIFAVFDPISLVNNYKETASSYALAHKTIFGFYPKYVEAVIADKMLKNLEKDKQLKRSAPFIRAQSNILKGAKVELKEQSFNLKWIEKIVSAAKASGSALFKELQAFEGD